MSIKDKVEDEFYQVDAILKHGDLIKARHELRDKFAMAALSGILVSAKHIHIESDMISELAYEYADSMLKARNQNG